jgi:hypothetical protein
MPINDGFDPNEAFPSFLDDRDDEHEQWIRSTLDLAGPSRVLGVSLLTTAVMAGGLAIALSLGNPVKIFAAMASLPQTSAAQRGADPSTPVQSISDVRTSGAASANQAQTKTNEPSAGILLAQFEAWAAKEDAQAQELADAQEQQREQARAQEQAQLEKAAPFPIAEDDSAPEQLTHKHRKIRSVKDASVENARAEIRHVQKPRARVQREQNAPGPAPTGQYALAQQQPVQSASPSFLQNLGVHQ